MKVRESGMPEESYWESLLDAELILDRLGIDEGVGDAVELGCGFGTFSLPLARRISGRLTAFDIDPAMVERTRARARAEGLANLHCELRDAAEGFGVPDTSQDACLLFNILHGEDPVGLLREAARAIKPRGRVHVIHWRGDVQTPRGPSLEIRPTPAQIQDWAFQAGRLQLIGEVVVLPPWHYGCSFERLPS